MTSTTPESRARIAYTAYLRVIHNRGPIPAEVPTFDQLPVVEREAWSLAANTIWDIATTGRATI